MTQERIEDLVALFIENRDAGETISPEDFAASHTDCAEALLAGLRRALETERFLRDPDLPTERLGPYHMLELIGSGGMGRVYRAKHDERPDEELALKVLSPLALSDAKARSRFEREGRALVQLDHAGIVAVFDHGVIDGVPFLAMEWVRGSSLAELLDRARPRSSADADGSPSDHLSLGGELGGHTRAASLTARLARAVAAAHSSGVLHRDIKPANVFLREDGSPVLGDFGLARGEETVSLTGSGDLLGTPRYMAPEQARGEEADERTDVHGLGVVLYELLTLQPPHPGSDPVSVLRAVAEQPVPPVSRLDPSVPAPLARILRRACAFRPAARYATAAALADDLEAFAAGAPVQAASFGPWEHLQDAWALRRKTLVGSAIALLVAASLPFLGGEEPDLDLLIERASLAYAADDMTGTAAGAERILAADPDNTTGLFLARLAEGQISAAAAKDDPTIRSMTDGVIHIQAQVWPAAVAAFEEACRLDPESPLPKLLLKQARDEMISQEFESYQKKVDERPESAVAWYELGRFLNGRERFAEGEEALRRATELDPNHQSAWVRLAIAQFYLDREQDVLASTVRGGPQVAVSYANTLLQRERDAAAEHVREVLAVVLQEQPDNHEAMHMVGWTYDFEHDMLDARRWYERALEEAPEHLIYLGDLAHWLSGSSSGTCPDCASWFQDHPGQKNLAESGSLYLRIVKLDRGRSERTRLAAESAAGIGQNRPMEAFIEGLLEQEGETLALEQRNRLVKTLEHLRR